MSCCWSHPPGCFGAPRRAAELSSKLQYPNANAASWPLLDPAVRDDPTVYPGAAVQAKLVLDREDSPEFLRLVSRAWTRFRTGT